MTQPPSAPTRRFSWVRFLEAYALLGALVLLGGVFGAIRPEAFLSWANISTMLGSQAVLVVLTMSLIIPLTAGDFDLSVANLETSKANLAASEAQLKVAEFQIQVAGAFGQARCDQPGTGLELARADETPAAWNADGELASLPELLDWIPLAVDIAAWAAAR